MTNKLTQDFDSFNIDDVSEIELDKTTESTLGLDVCHSPTNEEEIKSDKIKKSKSIGSYADFQNVELDMKNYERLFEGNRKFREEKLQNDPNYFTRLVNTQSPKYLLIGCSDSRVPPDQLTRTEPGEIFIHRNVANLVVNTDLNVTSVIQYAVEVLKVRHIIVMGHYGCGGVKASMEQNHHGLIDKWLRNIKDVQRLHINTLNEIKDEEAKFRRLVELNVLEQALNVCKTSIVQKAWQRGENVHVHGWVYDLATGIITDLEIEEKEWLAIRPIYQFNFIE